MSRVELSLYISRCEDELASTFLATGGSVANAAGHGPSALSISGCKRAVDVDIDGEGTRVTIPLDASAYTVTRNHLDSPVVSIKSDLRLIAETFRTGASISGALGYTFVGSASQPLVKLLRRRDAPSLLPVRYETLGSTTGTLGVSDAHLKLDDAEVSVDIHGVEEAERDELERAQKMIETVANTAWDRRKTMKYSPAPTLTKQTAKVTVGVNGCGYTLVDTLVGRASNHADDTIEGACRPPPLSPLLLPPPLPFAPRP